MEEMDSILSKWPIKFENFKTGKGEVKTIKTHTLRFGPRPPSSLVIILD